MRHSPAAVLEASTERVRNTRPFRMQGRVRRVVGLAIESDGPLAAVGEECRLVDPCGQVLSAAQVVGFAAHRIYSMPLGRLDGVTPDCRVVALGTRPAIGVGPESLGRVLDADGLPLDSRPAPACSVRYPLDADPPRALDREGIRQPFVTGVRAIDALVTLGRGQRVGIFAGSGVGKSMLLGMLARTSIADVAVIALVGERGREVRDFIESDLGPSGLARSVVFVSTSDEPPMRRIRATQAAIATAEYFRDRGRHVVFMIDSITRVAMAQREIGLSLGEPPSTKGYPPSTFSLLPRLLERAGALERGGTITGLYSVYVEGDDLNDPVGDAARSLLDGHLVLSRDLADRGHYPAIDTLASVSRVMPHVSGADHRKLARTLRRRMAALRQAEDLVLLGAYRSGSDPDVDAALAGRPAIERLLLQDVDDASTFDDTRARLEEAVRAGGDAR